MDPTRNRKEVHKFIGMISYYRYMWAIRLQTLKLLTKLISVNIRFKWTSVEQEAFDEVKQIVAKEVLLV